MLPWNNTSAAANRQPSSVPKKRKKKRKLKLRNVRKEVWFALAGVLAIIAVILIPRMIQTSKLKKLGYDKEAIAAIREKKLAKTLIDNQWFSPYLSSCLKSGTVNTDYLELYTVIEGEKYLDNTDFLMVCRLRDMGYEQDQILNLYRNLRFVELTPVLTYDYMLIEQNYIDDCLDHPENSRDSFILHQTYRKPYEYTYPADSSRVDMLVNKTYYLDSNFVPNDLTPLSVHSGASGTQLSKEAADAMEEWASAGKEMGVAFYATSSYRSYESQKNLYDVYVTQHGQQQADRESARPGFSEHQTGLTVDVAATGEEDKEFGDTTAFMWAGSNCADYGWILRYPENKEDITGYEYESWHFRYLGKELAKAVTKTGMTYDEFWCLYLKPWNDEANKPSQDILDSTDWHNLLIEPAEEESAEPDPNASPSAETTEQKTE